MFLITGLERIVLPFLFVIIELRLLVLGKFLIAFELQASLNAETRS